MLGFDECSLLLENNKIDIMLRNARQILKVVTATFPSFEEAGPSQECADSSSDIDDLACQWRSIVTGYEVLEIGDVDAWTESVIKVSSDTLHF
jgi:ethanolaminephosphotransferase